MTQEEIEQLAEKAASYTCWSDDSPRRVFQYGYEAGYSTARSRIAELERLLGLAIKTLEIFEPFEVQTGLEGGTYSPLLRGIDYKQHEIWKGFPAKDALEQIRATKIPLA